MDQSECQAAVRRHFRWLRLALQLQDWHLDVEYEKLDRGTLGNCSPMPDYRRATIRIDPSEHKDAAEVIDTLRHELIHVVLSSFDVYREMVEHHLSEEQERALSVGFRHACEEAVRRIEYFLDHGLGLDPAELGRRARRVQRKQDKERAA